MNEFKFVKSDSMKVDVLPSQEGELCTKETIADICKSETVIAFDVYRTGTLVGFALLRKYDENGYFLWNYAIDAKYQNRGFGTEILRELISIMRDEYGADELSTTYIFGNGHAKHVYEKVGFIETDVVDEPDCHEVNMELVINKA